MKTNIEPTTEIKKPLPSDSITEKFDSGEMRQLLDDEIARHALSYLDDTFDDTPITSPVERLSTREYKARLNEGLSGAAGVGGRTIWNHVHSKRAE